MKKRILVLLLGLSLSLGLTACDSSSTTTAEDSSVESAMSEEDYKAACVEIPYETLARDPENSKNKNIVIRGQIVQTLEDGEGRLDLRVNTGTDGYGWYDATVYVSYQYKEGELRLLENDVVTIYGVYLGLHTYESVMGSAITIPWIGANYIDLGAEEADQEEPEPSAPEPAEEETAAQPEGEFRPLEYSSKYGGTNIQGFYVTEETASDYFVNNYESLRSFETMEEFIDFKYSNIIYDFYVSVDPYPGTDTTDVTLCVKDDYGWSFEDFERIATDIMTASSMIKTAQTYFIYVTFEFYDGDSLFFDSSEYYVD